MQRIILVTGVSPETASRPGGLATVFRTKKNLVHGNPTDLFDSFSIHGGPQMLRKPCVLSADLPPPHRTIPNERPTYLRRAKWHRMKQIVSQQVVAPF
jgi:hypothetical protein